MTKKKKISTINDEIDLKLFYFIFKRNFFYPIIFLLVALIAAFLYLRYTQPVYEAKAIIQINKNEEAKLLGASSIFPEEDNFLPKKMELIKSAIFIQRVVDKLPLEISYFSKGTVLDYEQYTSSPYKVFAKVINSSIYNTPIQINFIEQTKCEIVYKNVNNETIKKVFSVSDTLNLNEVKLYISNINYKRIEVNEGFLSGDKFFFIINNPQAIPQDIISRINVSILNDAAKTIMIKYKDRSAEKANAIVNTIAEEFQSYDIEKQAESVEKILGYIDERMDIIYDTLVKSQENIADFNKKYNIDTIVNRPLPTFTSRLNDYQNQMVSLELEASKLDEIKNNLKSSVNNDISRIIAITAGSEFKGSISTLLSTLQELLIKREKLLYNVTENSGQIKEIDYQINMQKKLITESIDYVSGSINKRKAEIADKILMYERKLNFKTSDYNTVDLASLERIYQINENYYNQLIGKKAEYSIAKAGYVSQNIILQRSSTPTEPIEPIKKNIYLIAVFASLFLGLGIIIVRYVLFNNILTLYDIYKYTDIPVIGIVPKYIDSIPESQLIVDKHPKSIIAEALRSIRTNLHFLKNEEGPKVIAMSSTVSGEGKTFVIINLAGVIAFSEKKVIVLDFDLRKPKIHIGFNVVNTKGISTILSNKHNIDDCIIQSSLANLDFITAGPVPPNPSELIFSKRTDEVLSYLKTKYDYVLIDNPPIGLVTDGIKAMSIADYPIYVFKADYSKKFYVLDLERLAEDSKLKNISLVLNAVEPIGSSYGMKYSSKVKGSSYGYGFGYGYGYGIEDESSENRNKKSITNWISRLFKKGYQFGKQHRK
ncbi:MAG: polysaccharide biosynthesis tyrosine autokinase [Bacteroidales bacterium]|jgi:capsular exopolysaccharide synthesis family protein|nr:polysaccharide biosynthesis tyrosine autokinase [Bacteroidales bacterium]